MNKIDFNKYLILGMDKKTEKMIKKIRTKWHNQTQDNKGYFIRFIDGNPFNIHISNLEHIHPHDAFTNIDWKVDWDMDLSTKERQFVINNAENFATIYQK